MKKVAFYALVFLCVIALLYNSVYIQDLSTHRTTVAGRQFNAAHFVARELFPGLLSEHAMDISHFLDSLEYDFDGFATRQGKKLGISEDYYFLVGGTGRVVSVQAEDIILDVRDTQPSEILVATDFIYGNTLRDASGLVDIGAYRNTMDFNEISIALNRHVKENVLPHFLRDVEEGDRVTFKGGVKISIRSKDIASLRLIPYSLEIE